MVDSVNSPDDRREVHLLEYWRTIWRGRWTILSIFVVAVTLVAIGTFTQAPVYRAVAKVEIAAQARKLTPVADVADLGSGNYGWLAEERYFNTQYEIIRSRDVAQRVFDRLDLFNHRAFKDSADPIGAFASMIKVEPVKDTGIVEISIDGGDPQEVATWVNTVAESYVERNLDLAVQASGTAIKALLAEIAPLKEQLEDSQRTSFDYAEKANLYVPENQQKITGERLSTLEGDLTATQVKLSENEGLLRQINEVKARGDSFESISQVSGDPIVQGLYKEKVGLEREYERLLVTYKERHTRVLEKQSEIDKINQKIASEVDRIFANLKTETRLLMDRERELSKAIESTKTDSMRSIRKVTSYDLVRGEVVETKRIYDMISARIKEIDLSASLLSNNLRILDRAPIPRHPVKPRPLLNMAIGVLLGLLMGVGTVFFLDYMDNTIRTAEDIEQYLKLNLLAIVPRQTEGTEGAVREAYQTLRTSLLFARKNRQANVVLVTSAGPEEGKSCTIISVAQTLANAGEKTAVLDCDLRRPTIHQRLGISRERGVTNYILSSDGDDWRHYLKPTDHPNLFAMTCGPIPPNPADVFGHERFQTLLKELRPQFDWVFIDSPPVVSLADSLILASLADSVVFVVKHKANDRDLILRCVQNVRKVNPAVVGAVLNNVDLDRSHYKDYYYVGYYYYGESSGKKGKKRTRPDAIAAAGDAGAKETIGRSAG